MKIAHLKIKLFGEFRVWRGEESIKEEEWGGQKPRSLLKLLLTRPGRAFSKDEIVEILWPGTFPQSADRSLRVAVSLLRRTLEPELGRGFDSRYILGKRPGYSFNEQADCEVDAWKFQEYRQRAEAAQEAGELADAIREYREALNLVSGEFLAEEPYEDWALEPREEWRQSRLAALSGLAECLALKGRYTHAIEASERALALDEYREELHRRLMLYHYCSGEQGLALRAYRDYARVVKEVGADPSPELVRLKEQIEARNVPGVDERRCYPRPRRLLRYPYSLSRMRFVGRDREYAWLVERLREAAEGVGGAVAVEGEAGVGKTRLAEEFLGYARSRGASVLSGRCFERELGAPLEPVVDALESLPTTDDVVTRVTYPELGYQQEAEPHDSARLYRALTKELVRESREGGHEGLILFMDDVQWADPATLDFLAYLAKRILNERILLVVAYRREDAPGLWGWLKRLAVRRTVTNLSLDRLTLEDVTEMLRPMSSRGFGELASLADFLHRESEGNAFYAGEYLRWLIEAGIVEIDARRRIAGLESGLLREGILPYGVQSLLEAWLDETGVEARGMLELAAVVGRRFDLELLCRATARDEAETFSLLRPLMASGLVVETSEEAYYFSHDKVRQTLYEGIEGPRRRELHLRAAKTLEEGGEPAELAHHYLRARAWGPALENLVRAARKAEESYAWDTALETYARALEVTEKLPGSEETRSLRAKAEALVLLGGLLHRSLDRPEEGLNAYEVATNIYRKIDDAYRLQELLLNLAGLRWRIGNFEGSARGYEEALELAQAHGDSTQEAAALASLSVVYRDLGRLEDSVQSGRVALGLLRGLNDPQAEAYVLTSLADSHVGLGHHLSALSCLRRSLRLRRKIGDTEGEVGVLGDLAKVYEKLGDADRAQASSKEVARKQRTQEVVPRRRN